MKKFIYMASAAALLASCSDDIHMDVTAPGQQVEVTFSAALPTEMMSRAVSDGETANQLSYTVFKSDGSVVLSETIEAFQSTVRTQVVSIPLITGETYTIAFWADKKDNGLYTYNDGKISINYANAKANDESADAFFWTEKNYKVTGSASKTVTLTRPFAQINFGTTQADHEAAVKSGLDISTTQVTVSGTTYTSLNLLDGSVDGKADVTYALNTRPSNPETLTVEGADYVYVAYAYVLTPPADKSENLTKVTLTPKATDAAVREYTTVPVKRNYRTNIIGNLFTSNVDFKVVIDQNYVDDINAGVWDGSVTEPVIDMDNSTVQISNAAQLAWLADYVNNATTQISRATTVPYSFSGWTVELTDDIYLCGEPWTPIGTNSDSGRKFKGTFDGKGYTIYGLNVDQGAAYHGAGLFGALNGTAKNFTIDGAYINSISSGDPTDNGIAVVAGSIYPSGTISGVTVKNAEMYGNRYMGGIAGYVYGTIENCTVDGITMLCTPNLVGTKYDNGDKVGAVAGYFNSDDSRNKLSGNTVNNAKITGYRDLGGLAGCADAAGYVTDCKVTNSTICASAKNSYSGHSAGENIGEIVGRQITSSLASSNTYENVTLITQLVSSMEELSNAISNAQDGDVITLDQGTYEWTNVSITNKNITIQGMGENSIIDTSNSSGESGKGMVYTNGSTVTLKDLTITFPGTNYAGFGAGGTAVTYENCKIVNVNWGYATTTTYNDCTFTFSDPSITNSYVLWSWGANLTFNDCTFEGGNRALLIYSEASHDLTFNINNCSFTGNENPSSAKPAIQVNGSNGACYVNISNSTATGYATGSTSNSQLWDVKSGVKAKVTIDEEEVYNSIN